MTSHSLISRLQTLDTALQHNVLSVCKDDVLAFCVALAAHRQPPTPNLVLPLQDLAALAQALAADMATDLDAGSQTMFGNAHAGTSLATLQMSLQGPTPTKPASSVGTANL